MKNKILVIFFISILFSSIIYKFTLSNNKYILILGDNYFKSSYNKDYINMPKYTLVVRDLIDNDNYFEKTGNYGEFTSGYTIKQIENSLKNVKTWQEWRNKIKQDYENPTENNLDTVFNYWFLEQ